MTGTFIAVVGPSGVGKDTVMAALAQSDPNFVLARRVITRPSTAGGEDFEGITKPEFIDRAARGDFVMHWEAHGLCYGIPRNVISYLNAGRNVLANLSRDTLKQAMALFPNGRIILLTASSETLAQRLAQRGRETPQEISARLRKAERSIPSDLPVTTIRNDGSLEETLNDIRAVLQPDKAAR